MKKHLHEIEEGLVMIPEDEFERVHVNCFVMALKRSFSGFEIDTLVVKEFSIKFKTDFIDMLLLIKTMLGEL